MGQKINMTKFKQKLNLKIQHPETHSYFKYQITKKIILRTQQEIIVKEKENNEPELEGFVLFDKEKGEIGEILKVDDFSGNVVLSVLYNHEEIMVPFHEDLIISIQHPQKIITTRGKKSVSRSLVFDWHKRFSDGQENLYERPG